MEEKLTFSGHDNSLKMYLRALSDLDITHYVLNPKEDNFPEELKKQMDLIGLDTPILIDKKNIPKHLESLKSVPEHQGLEYDISVMSEDCMTFIIEKAGKKVSEGIRYKISSSSVSGFEIISIDDQSMLFQESIKSRYDALTGVLNRGGLEEALSYEAIRRERDGPLSMIMIDIDHFKRINDIYGHQRGDEVLKDIAKLLDNTIRTTDHIGRYGGEEFMAVLPSTPIKGAYMLADRLRREVSRKFSESDVGTITISCGISSIKDRQDLEAAIGRADTALYRAKNAGRNCVY